VNTNDAFRQFNNNEVDVLLINQSGSTGASAHAIITPKVVKEKVKQIISQENQNSPISDQKIVELLLKENINIARRTVAKYRDMLGILPSSKRKKIF
jgi:RNA polymerase sigma-54 factor